MPNKQMGVKPSNGFCQRGLYSDSFMGLTSFSQSLGDLVLAYWCPLFLVHTGERK